MNSNIAQWFVHLWENFDTTQWFLYIRVNKLFLHLRVNSDAARWFLHLRMKKIFLHLRVNSDMTLWYCILRWIINGSTDELWLRLLILLLLLCTKSAYCYDHILLILIRALLILLIELHILHCIVNWHIEWLLSAFVNISYCIAFLKLLFIVKLMNSIDVRIAVH